MIARNVTTEQMDRALEKVNEKYENNIAWNRFERKGNTIHFTLKVKSSRGAGHRLGHYRPWSNDRQKRLPHACWHVHGHFFDALLEINPDAVVRTGRSGRIDRNGGNWQDWNAGSMMYPTQMSELCEC